MTISESEESASGSRRGGADDAAPDPRWRRWWDRYGSILRYLLVGGFNTLLDIGLFTLFASFLGMQALVANVLSTVITLCVSYLLNRTFVFRSDRKHSHTLVQFVAVTLLSGLVIQSLVIWLVMAIGGAVAPGVPTEVMAPIAKVCAVSVGMVSNYLGYRWLFRSRSQPHESA